MLHRFGRDNGIEGTHNLDKLLLTDLNSYYMNILRLYYADKEAREWLAKKIREDIPFYAKAMGLSAKEAQYQWLKAQYHCLRSVMKEHYEGIEQEIDENGDRIETYVLWIEEKEYKNPVGDFLYKEG